MKNSIRTAFFPTITMLCLLAFFSVSFYASTPAIAKKDRAVIFMKRVAKEVMAAVRSRDKDNLRKVIKRYADVKGIGNFSLGQYKKRLPRRKRPRYYLGVAKFMARYFMDQSKKYNVVSARVESPSFKQFGERIVDTVVKLKDGSEYEVRFRLTKKGRSYKIRDISILGLWLVPFQKDLFGNFVRERNGNVNDLVIALNHN